MNGDKLKQAASQVDESARDVGNQNATTQASASPYSPPLTAGSHNREGVVAEDCTEKSNETQSNILASGDSNETLAPRDNPETQYNLDKQAAQKSSNDSSTEQQPSDTLSGKAPPKNGRYESVNKDSKRHVITYDQGQVTGPFAIYDSNNRLETEGYMENGKLCRVCRTYEYGILKCESEMLNDQPHGITKQFDKAGKLQVETWFVHGKKQGEMKQYKQDGTIISTTMYEADEINGKSEAYNDSGDISSRTDYVKGKMHGTMEAFYSRAEGSGLKRLSHYDSGDLHGKETIYQASGNILSEAQYDHGRPITDHPVVLRT
jgi:antitoxin component YwqK of YwqJK toxin-antitoxin module